MKQTTQHSNKAVAIDIENPMLIANQRATHFSKRLISILRHNKIPVFLAFVITFTFKTFLRSQRMKRKTLSFLMGLSLALVMIVLKAMR